MTKKWHMLSHAAFLSNCCNLAQFTVRFDLTHSITHNTECKAVTTKEYFLSVSNIEDVPVHVSTVVACLHDPGNSWAVISQY